MVVIFSILVELSYHVIVGRLFEVVVFAMVPMQNVLQQRDIWSHQKISGVGGKVEVKTSF